MLAGCATSTQFASAPPTLAPPPAALVQRCPSPVDLAEGNLSAGEVAGHWARDRANLARCRDRHSALAAFIDNRDAALRGEGREGGR